MYQGIVNLPTLTLNKCIEKNKTILTFTSIANVGLNKYTTHV